MKCLDILGRGASELDICLAIDDSIDFVISQLANTLDDSFPNPWVFFDFAGREIDVEYHTDRESLLLWK